MSQGAGGRMELLRLLAASLAVGGAAFLVSLLFWPIEHDLRFWLVKRYEALSVDPFRRSEYSHRILAPLLAHVLHLDGERFRVLTLSCSVLLLAGIHWYCRRSGVGAAGSVLVVLAFAISRTVGNSSQLPGLTDTLTYFLLLLSLLSIARPFAFWVLFALNLLNHEQIVFLLPWLLYLRRAAGATRLLHDAAAAAVILGLYAALRFSLGYGVVAHHAAFIGRPPSDYLAEYLMVWWFLLSSFGFLLALLCAYAARGRFERNSVLLCLLCAAATYVTAWDPYRYIHLFFAVVLMAAVRFLLERGRLAWFAALLLGNVLVHQAGLAIMRRAIPWIGRAAARRRTPSGASTSRPCTSRRPRSPSSRSCGGSGGASRGGNPRRGGPGTT